MIGSRPLTDEEINAVLTHLTTTRDKALFILGIRTGFRISELLSLTIKDVSQKQGGICDRITVRRANMKGSVSSRSVVLHPDAKRILRELNLSSYGLTSRLFPFTRMQAHRIIKRAVNRACLEGKVTTHSMRKTFASRVYEALDHDLVKTQAAMGHRSVSSTIAYLSFNQEDVDEAILGVK
jgi:integrase